MSTADLSATMEKLAPSLVKGVVDIAEAQEAEAEISEAEKDQTPMTLNELKKK